MAKKTKNVRKIKAGFDRNEEAVELVKERVSKQKQKITIVQKNDFIKNLFNGRYYLARLNMIADQLNGEIVENIDGCLKSKELMHAEYALMRMRALEGIRNSNEAKRNLQNSGLTNKDVDNVVLSYYEDKIIEEKISEPEIKKTEAVQSDK